ncbi:MAG: hypothetical protein N3F65_02345 [Nitrososphaeria archaeon]|nr:hypothetical protein [Aigarchaeota archaeon]MCX8187433.1 hypothetical protein [Nitrososphaeria archaeon]MDW8021107.1 hypothetical protein [Nitrososphaerota archaeon]
MSYRVRIRSPTGFEIEIEGDRDFIESKLTDLGWLENLLDKTGSPAQKVMRVAPTDRKPSFMEFASLLNPKTNGEKVLAVAYYFYKWEDKDVTYDDVEQYFKHARWSMPGNVRDVMSNLIRDGYMEEAGKINDRKTFRILLRGIKLIEESLQGGEGS